MYGCSERDERRPESWETATPFHTPRKTWLDPSCSGSPLWNGIETQHDDWNENGTINSYYIKIVRNTLNKGHQACTPAMAAKSTCMLHLSKSITSCFRAFTPAASRKLIGPQSITTLRTLQVVIHGIVHNSNG